MEWFRRNDMPDVGTQSCVHHWVLSIPEEEIVQGRCKRCGATRSYPATVEGASRQGVYEEAASLNRSAQLVPDLGARTAAK
jgi:hypothetical protein